MTKDGWPDPHKYEKFKDFEQAWHKAYQTLNPNYKEHEMYMNGQFDDLPFSEWAEAGGTF